MNWLDAYEAKLKAATPGPWTWYGWKTDAGTRYQHIMAVGYENQSWGWGVARTYHTDAVRDYLEPRHGNHNDAEFISASPEMVAKLIAAVRTAEKALDRIQMYRAGDYAHDCISIALSTLAKLQSGEFEGVTIE